MSMICHLRQLPPVELAELQAHPERVVPTVHPETTDSEIMRLREETQRLGRAVVNNPKDATLRGEYMEAVKMTSKLAAKYNSPAELEIEKSWHGIHFLLTGTAWEVMPPLGNVLLGGTEIGEDVGYGPARYLTPQQVAEVSAELEKITEENLRQRFKFEELERAQIYAITSAGDIEYLLGHFSRVVAHYRDAARNGNAMLLYLD